MRFRMPSGEGLIVQDVNQDGQVVGYGDTDPESTFKWRTFTWEAGSFTDLGTLGGDESFGERVNGLGEVVGTSRRTDGTFGPFIWANGTMTDLAPELSGYFGVTDINDSGQVVFDYAEGTRSTTRAYLWENGDLMELPALGGDFSSAAAINEQGFIVGSAALSDGTVRAVLWRPLTAVESIEATKDAVENLLAAGELKEGTANSLTSKLNVSTGLLNDAKTTPALKMLEAFINQLNGLMPEQLDPALGQPLVDQVQALIDALGG
jgi:probable HAF family extracellular repeat protein